MDMPVEKQCIKCGNIKPIEAFVKSVHESKDGTRNCCKVCKNEADRQWKKDHPELWNARHDRYYQTLKGAIGKKVYDSARRAKQYGLACDITTEYVLDLYNKQQGHCALTDIVFQYDKDALVIGAFKPYSISIDRIDNNGGYTQGNSRLLCLAVNYALNEFGDSVFNDLMLSLLDNAHIPAPLHQTGYSVGNDWHRQYSLTPRGRMHFLLCSRRNVARKLSIDCDLTVDWLLDRYNQQQARCQMSGIEFDLSRLAKSKRHPYGPSIDRIDYKLGYTKDNVRLVNIATNYALNQFGEDILRHIASCYKDYQSRKLHPTP